MLITFHSVGRSADVDRPRRRAAAGRGQVLRGQDSGTRRFTADQLGPAIQGIERAIADYQKSGHDDDEDEDKPVAPMARAVGLKERAFPLLDMMRQSQAAGAEVTWEVSRGW